MERDVIGSGEQGAGLSGLLARAVIIGMSVNEPVIGEKNSLR